MMINNEGFQSTVGFLGLGKIGAKIARRISMTTPVLGYDVHPAHAADAAACGIAIAGTVGEVARRANAVLLSLPSPEVVAEVVSGRAGLLCAESRPSLIIDLSTTSPSASQRLAEVCQSVGVMFLDAPLTGGMVGAEEGTFTAMVGGEVEAVRSAMPLLQLFCRRVVHVGPSGHGASVKLLHNMVGEIQVYAFAEAFALAARLGLNLDRVFEVLCHGMATSRILTELYARGALRGSLKPSATVATAEKAQRLLLEMASASGVELFFTPLIYARIKELIKRGHANDDVTTALSLFEEQMGVTARISDELAQLATGKGETRA